MYDPSTLGHKAALWSGNWRCHYKSPRHYRSGWRWVVFFFGGVEIGQVGEIRGEDNYITILQIQTSIDK